MKILHLVAFIFLMLHLVNYRVFKGPREAPEY